MKCPKCGKKMKTAICGLCGYNPLAKEETPATTETVMPTSYAPKINYYTYDPANPSVWYPMTASTQAQPNPATVSVAPSVESAPVSVEETPAVPMSKKAAKKAAKAAKKANKKSAKEAGKKATKSEKKAMKKAEKAAKKAAKKNVNVVLSDKPVRKNVASRLFALVLLALCACTFAVLTFNAIVGVSDGTFELSATTLLDMLLNAFKSDVKLFGVLPAFFNGEGADLYNISIYVFALCGALAALHALFAIFSKKKAPRRVRRSLFFLGVGALFYAVAMALLLQSGTMGEGVENMIALAGFNFDLYALAIGAGGVVLSFLFLIFRRRDKNK